MTLFEAIESLRLNHEFYADQGTVFQNYIIAVTIEGDKFTLLQLEYTHELSSFNCFTSTSELVEEIDQQDTFSATDATKFYSCIPEKFRNLNYFSCELNDSPLDYAPLAWLSMLFPKQFPPFMGGKLPPQLQRIFINKARSNIQDINSH